MNAIYVLQEEDLEDVLLNLAAPYYLVKEKVCFLLLGVLLNVVGQTFAQRFLFSDYSLQFLVRKKLLTAVKTYQRTSKN